MRSMMKPGLAGADFSSPHLAIAIVRGTLSTLAAQARTDRSERHLEDTLGEIADGIRAMLADAFGVATTSARDAAADRGRSARTTAPLGAPFLRGEDGTLYVGGDLCLGACLEAAYFYGAAIASAIIKHEVSL
ncbi:hypothetical protein GCM10007973_08330 [Polymorphobacter multimanifer]|uniref:Putative NAD/FAD-dependent oxidoreductase n=2 Tax=Polymorphobacter multimanifer TaxID=1070431 RepID=A0A841LBB0_9SPHN|nr:hypothetical protein [Polymorphobacter multimanifer]MBB6228951.1 putative NAD/FAD-dependent oxidoreductase [Polymorphobacter multimanifer]GGI73829.1 hypothetical protein GCM10007973_08330 [Polymorphobacter multimanifer]